MNNKNLLQKQSGPYGFFFVKPKKGLNADSVARQLMSVKGIDEVYVTEGDCGFIVKTKKFAFQLDGEEEELALQKLVEKASRTPGSTVRKAVGHIQYVRA